MAKISVTCPNCSAPYQVDAALRGKKGRCARCRAEFVLANAGRASPGAAAGEAQGERRFPTEDAVPAVFQKNDVLLDLYEVREVFSGGGMGLVYRVHHRGWNQDLAVKSPRPQLLTREGAAEDFEREAETWVKLGLHPHTVTCFYVRRLGGIPRVFAEFVEGGSLADWIRDEKGHPGMLYAGGPEQALERILDVAIQFAWGLHYAHERGLVHQDVKPANVMMTGDGTAKVTDFGLAKARAAAGEQQRPAGQSILVSCGGMTPAYCSPEQAAGKPLSRKTDVYSWAVSVLEMFTGEVTWSAGQIAHEALNMYLEEPATNPGLPTLPPGLAALLRQCLQPRPEARPAGMREVADALREVYRQVTGRPHGREPPRPGDLLADSLNNQAVSLLDLGQEKRAEAEQLWEKALQADARHAEAAYNLGLARWRAGRLREDLLVQRMREVAASHPGEWVALYLLAQVHWERGDGEAALQALGQIAGADADREEVRSLRARAECGAPGRYLVRTFEGHTGEVSAAALHPDGRLAASGSRDRTVKVWEVDTGRCLATLEHAAWVTAVCWTGDGRHVLTGDADGTIRVWDWARAACVRTMEGESGGVTSLSATRDGRHVLSGAGADWDRTPKLWDLASGACLRTFPANTHRVPSVWVSADGRLALSNDNGRCLSLWEVATGKCLRTLSRMGGAADLLAAWMSADGRLALSGGMDLALRLWDLGTGQCLRAFEGHGQAPTAVCLSPSGQTLLSGGSDGTLSVWDVATGRCLRTIPAHPGNWVRSVCWSPDGRRALSAGGQALKLWQVAWEGVAPAALSRVSSSEEVLSGEKAFAGEVARAREALGRGDWGLAARHLRKAREPAGYRRHPAAVALWGRLYLHSARRALQDAWEERALEGHAGEVLSVFLSRDGRLALSGSGTLTLRGQRDWTLRLWEVATGKCLRTFQGHASWVNSGCLGADGRLALSGSGDKTLRLWDVATGRCLRTFEGHEGSVRSVDLSRDARLALSGSEDETLRLWETATGRCLRTLAGHKGTIRAVDWDPGAQYAFSGGEDGTLRAWEVATGGCLRTFQGHAEQVTSVRVSEDGRFVLSGSFDKTLKLWEVATGQCLRTFQGHTDKVGSVSLSRDGRYALSGGWDETVRLWDVATVRCLRTIAEPGLSACLSADGRYALWGNDRVIKVWLLDWELEERAPAAWDEGALPYLQAFLALHTPRVAALPKDREPTAEAITRALTRRGKPTWLEEDFRQLLDTLGCAGYGWLRPEGVRRELEKMAAAWQGPPPLG